MIDGRIYRANYQKTLREDKRKEKIMELKLHPKVVEVIDRENLTPLQGLILHHLTDPNVEYSTKSIAQTCQKTLGGQGSKRSVRRVRTELAEIVKEVELARVMEAETDVFDAREEEDGHGAFEEDHGGNGEDKDGIIELSDGGWDVTEQLDCVTACSKAPQKALVSISAVARKKISLFMKWAGSQEWLAYLKGEFIDESNVIVTDVALPDSQNASATLVHNVVMNDYKGIVGVIHSHHDMGHGSTDNPGFSGHDNEFINSNHNVSLLVSKKGIAGHIRVKTPCGAFMKVVAKVKHMDEVELDEKKLQEEFKNNIRFGGGQTGGTVTYVGDGKDYFPQNRQPTRDNYHF